MRTPSKCSSLGLSLGDLVVCHAFLFVMICHSVGIHVQEVVGILGSSSRRLKFMWVLVLQCGPSMVTYPHKYRYMSRYLAVHGLQ